MEELNFYKKLNASWRIYRQPLALSPNESPKETFSCYILLSTCYNSISINIRNKQFIAYILIHLHMEGVKLKGDLGKLGAEILLKSFSNMFSYYNGLSLDFKGNIEFLAD